MMTTIRKFTAGLLLAVAYGAKWLGDKIAPQRGGGQGEE
jgi:hypothetical protein